MNKHKKIISEAKDTTIAKINDKGFNAIKILDYLKNNVSDHIFINNDKLLKCGAEAIVFSSEINPKNKINSIDKLNEQNKYLLKFKTKSHGHDEK
jgi:hypothetical protein